MQCFRRTRPPCGAGGLCGQPSRITIGGIPLCQAHFERYSTMVAIAQRVKNPITGKRSRWKPPLTHPLVQMDLQATDEYPAVHR